MKPKMVLQRGGALIGVLLSPGVTMAADSSDVCNNVGTPGLKELLVAAGCGPGKNPIYALLQAAINWISGILLILAVLALIVSGIQYITSQGNPEGIKSAKGRMTNAVIGVILLILMQAILRFIGVI